MEIQVAQACQAAISIGATITPICLRGGQLRAKARHPAAYPLRVAPREASAAVFSNASKVLSPRPANESSTMRGAKAPRVIHHPMAQEVHGTSIKSATHCQRLFNGA